MRQHAVTYGRANSSARLMRQRTVTYGRANQRRMDYGVLYSNWLMNDQHWPTQ